MAENKVVSKLKELLGIAEKFASATLEDGTEIQYEGELAVDTIVMVVVDGAEVPLAEGTHALGGDMAGKTITVDATGKILEVGEVAAAEENSEAVEALAKLTGEQMKAQKESFKKEVDALKKENADLKKEQENLSKKMEQLAADFANGKVKPADYKAPAKTQTFNKLIP